MEMPYDAEVLFCRGTGLTPAYQHTYRFRTRREQEIFFISKSPFRNSKMSYIRVSSNSMDVEQPIGALYLCDYLMISPHRDDGVPSGGNAFWFYCFITEVEYINEGCTRIHFLPDPVQTWFTECFVNMNSCMVIRHHSANDALIANTQAEDIDLGTEYVYNDQGWENINTQFSTNGDGSYKGWYPIVVYPTAQFEYNVYSRVPSFIVQGVMTDKDFFRNFLDGMTGAEQAEIVDMYMYPEKLLPETNGREKIITNKCPIPGRNGYNPWDGKWGSGTGYTPKNNKMYTYPFCYIVVTNGCGQSMVIKPEYIERYVDDGETWLNELVFQITGSFGSNPEFMCTLKDGYCNLRTPDILNSITLTGSPKLPWKTDAYKIYTSQNASSIRVANVMAAKNIVTGAIDTVQSGVGNLVKSVGSVGRMMDTADAINSVGWDSFGAVAGGVSAPTIGNIQGVSKVESGISHYAKQRDMKNLPDQVNNGQAPNVQYTRGFFGFHCYIARCNTEYAIKADNMFTVYGYRLGRMYKPNIFSRPHFNFLQCENMTTTNNVPADDYAAIQSIMAKGITFWDKDTRLGDYSVDNSPT